MTNRERVLSFVQNNSGCTQKEISKALGITPVQQVSQILDRLKKDGLIKSDEQKRPYKYYLVSTNVQTSTEPHYAKGEEEDILKNITKENLLIIASCTKHKYWDKDLWGPTYVPAIHAYTGFDVKWVKNKISKRKGFRILILSAKYGFIEPEHPIHFYDVTFNDERTGSISIDSLKNQVCCQTRLFGEHEQNLRDFRFVLVKDKSKDKKYIKKCEEAFFSTAMVLELTEAIWNKIVAKLDP